MGCRGEGLALAWAKEGVAPGVGGGARPEDGPTDCREVHDRVRERQDAHGIGPVMLHKALLPLGPILDGADDRGRGGAPPRQLGSSHVAKRLRVGQPTDVREHRGPNPHGFIRRRRRLDLSQGQRLHPDDWSRSARLRRQTAAVSATPRPVS